MASLGTAQCVAATVPSQLGGQIQRYQDQCKQGQRNQAPGSHDDAKMD